MPNHQATIHQPVIIKEEDKKRPIPYTNRTLAYSVYRKRIRIFVGTTDYTDEHRFDDYREKTICANLRNPW